MKHFFRGFEDLLNPAIWIREWKASVPTFTATHGTEGPRVDWNGRMERNCVKERETVVAEAVRRRVTSKTFPPLT